MCSRIRFLVIALWTALLPYCALAQRRPIALDPQQRRIEITSGANILADPSNRMTIQDVVASSAFHAMPDDQRVSPFSSTYWVRIPIHRPAGTTTRWYLRLDSGWELVDFYQPQGVGYVHYFSGSVLPPSERPIDSHLIVFPLFLNDDATLYIRLQGDTSRYGSARTAHMIIEREDIFLSDTRRLNYAQGIYAGLIIAMVCYNLILFFGVKEWTYLFYSVYVASFGLVWMGRAAFTHDLLWPRAPAWELSSGFYLIAIAIFFSVFFVRSFLNTRTWSRRLDFVLWALAAITVAIALLAMATSVQVASPVLAVDALLTSLFYGVIGILMLIRGYRPARMFLTAWWVLIGTNIVYILAYLEFLPKNAFTYNSAQIGSAFECILLAFALADRVNSMKSEREREQGQYTARLEYEVHRRTMELSELNEQLADASITDPLTGLKNRRFVDATIDSLTAEIRRGLYRGGEQRELLILIADLDHFKRINDNYGHDFGDRMLKLTAAVLSKNVRGTTILARWGGEEFLLLDRVRPADNDQLFAERLRRTIGDENDLGAPDGALNLTVSIGMARYPFSRKHPELLAWNDVLSLADQALYQAKNSGRNRWVGLCPNEDRLHDYLTLHGVEATRALCRTQISEALRLGLIEPITAGADAQSRA